MSAQYLALPASAQLSAADEAALTDVYRRGTPPNTLRAWERDLAYIAAWKMAAFGTPLLWPEDERVALRFILDHAQDLTEKPGRSQDVALELQALGLRIALRCPAPATLDRRIASWQAFHRMGNLTAPFAAPLVQQAPRLPMKGRAARALVHRLEVTKITQGPLFRPVSKSDRPLPRRLAADALRVILRHRLTLAGLSVDFATPHGLRAGFLTQAALDGAPLATAMKLSLHRSAIQAQKYYADIDISENPATDLLGE
jgi:hypothetical protein